MIEITGTVVGAVEVQRRFEIASGTVRDRVRRAVQAGGLKVLATVKEKLSGEVLNVRTGALRRSANEDTVVDGDAITSTVGTNKVYGRFWELGFNGTEQVRAYMRTGTKASAQVRAHSRRVNQPARPFLAPALEQRKAEVIAGIEAALKEAV